MRRVLEVNVDDLHTGGVYALVKNVIQNNNHQELKIDIAAIEKFQKQSNIDFLKQYNCNVFYVGIEGNKWKKQIAVYRKLKSLISNYQYSSVHIHADTANKLLVSGVAAKAAGTKRIILHSHSSGIDGDHRAIKKAMHYLCRMFLPCVGNIFVACSDYAAAWMFPKLDREKIVIINNGVDLKKFQYDESVRKKIREELKINNDEILLGHVGRFLYQKNHEYLIEIIQRIKELGLKSKLLLIGEGERINEIYELVNRKGLLDDVIFWGASDNVNELMMAMDIFLLPSHFEGLPIVGVEAQAAGLPVIFSDEITKEASLTDNVYYLPIGRDNIEEWVITIMTVSKMMIDRNKYEVLKNKQFDIRDTVKSFTELYCNDYV